MVSVVEQAIAPVAVGAVPRRAHTAIHGEPCRCPSISSHGRRLRVKTLEARNRELTEQLEAAYGRLAVVQPKLGSLHQANIATLGKRDC